MHIPHVHYVIFLMSLELLTNVQYNVRTHKMATGMLWFWKRMCTYDGIDRNHSWMRVGQENIMSLCTVHKIWEFNF